MTSKELRLITDKARKNQLANNLYIRCCKCNSRVTDGRCTECEVKK